MSLLLEYREKLNLTQEELATRSGLSVRTIQRIESGIIPKGYTLEALSKALDINKDDLLVVEKESIEFNTQLIKYINLSSILLLIIPLGSIIMPLIIMHWKKEVNVITKKIVSIQIIWTIAFPIVMVLVNIVGDWFSVNNEIVPLGVFALIVTNLYIILRNTIEIDKNKTLRFQLNFNIM